jgi:hydrogenase expression/formation protein HypC
MCIAVPMKLIEINGKTGKVLFSGNEVTVNLSLVSPKIGDYLLIHAGCAIEIVEQGSAEEILDIFKSLTEAAYEPE